MGLRGFNFGAGSIGNVLIWVVVVFVVFSFILALFIWLYYRRTFSQKISVYGLVGNKSSLIYEDKAKLQKFGMAGDVLFYHRKSKKYTAPPNIHMGPKLWWYWRRADGELINIGLGDIDEEMRKAGAYFVDTDVRMQRLGIEKNLRDRFQKESFWAKYGTTIVGAIFMVLVTVSLVVLFAKLVDVSEALTQTSIAIKDMATAVNRFYGGDEPSGLVPSEVFLSLIT